MTHPPCELTEHEQSTMQSMFQNIPDSMRNMKLSKKLYDDLDEAMFRDTLRDKIGYYPRNPKSKPIKPHAVRGHQIAVNDLGFITEPTYRMKMLILEGMYGASDTPPTERQLTAIMTFLVLAYIRHAEEQFEQENYPAWAK